MKKNTFITLILAATFLVTWLITKNQVSLGVFIGILGGVLFVENIK